MTTLDARDTSRQLLRFIESGPTAAHAVEAAVTQLTQAGFRQIHEKDAWKLQGGERFFVVRHHQALVAGVLGSGDFVDHGFRLAGAHVDAPGLRLKPHAEYASKQHMQLGVEVYGGPILATWFDRDLTLAGKLFVRHGDDQPRVVLVKGDRALCRIPSLAIHFNREVNEQGFKVDKQKHLAPVFGFGDDEKLRSEALLHYLADLVQIDNNDIVGVELELVDVQPPSIGGIDGELLFAPRIDNLAGSHALLSAILEAPVDCGATRLIALFDSEEIGSQTYAGAGSSFIDDVLERLCLNTGRTREALFRALSLSTLVSVDGAHALHPNYADFHDAHHQPLLNAGPVIKVNAMQRYATNMQSQHWLERCAARADVPLQHYVHRTDLACGSTIGPMTATRLGVSTVDVGSPMLSMHSIRETGGLNDQRYMIELLKQHFSD